jgi:hypothetical protein
VTGLVVLTKSGDTEVESRIRGIVNRYKGKVCIVHSLI